MAKEFEGRLVMITGGAGDIARAAARRFAEEGARLLLADTDAKGLDAACAELQAKGAGAEGRLLDVTDVGAVEAAVESLRGGLDVLVHCAGIYRHRLVAEMTEQEWDETLAVNLKGAFAVCRAAGRAMATRERGGAIVNLASVSAQRGSALHAHYCASKAGLVGFGRALALELAPRVRVNAVAPGIIESRMIADMLPVRGEEWKRQIPLARYGRPEDVAEAILFLAGDRASYVNGAVLNVNGGMWMD
ncbi:MAG: hypothetical protein A3J27_03805 [Candidatus Tectomicrobia bacterium RIFCSPLOWO2_12_FULL_69_37]|nr:MAG: hypothetical protein A3I72_07855 [Candidatus Tectomicrobia bacterium RIFCSPLOWO2_02_FULL_70_19]OGL64156.1 MAG: hypothetical protein A3J27_03805 [Candidatus Tectomicrobia bacterium RIFCSPLOWO2_12_FULL_69_37]